MRILAISDTHGVFPDGFDFHSLGCDVVFHAGDIGSPAFLSGLYECEQWHAVKGNTDFDLDDSIPETFFSDQYGPRIFMVHNLAAPHRIIEYNRQKIATFSPDIVIYGHTHLPTIVRRDGKLFVNPGTLGKLGLTNIRSYAIIDTADTGLDEVRLINADTGTVVESWKGIVYERSHR